MKDEELIERLENCTLSGASFHHPDHVKVVSLAAVAVAVIRCLPSRPKQILCTGTRILGSGVFRRSTLGKKLRLRLATFYDLID
jgi:hypothetical protein